VRWAHKLDDSLDRILLLAQQVADEQFNSGAGPSRSTSADAGVQTGGVAGAGRVISRGRTGGKPRDLHYVVSKLRSSMPLLATAQLDAYFR
jgi:hypothetical protein